LVLNRREFKTGIFHALSHTLLVIVVTALFLSSISSEALQLNKPQYPNAGNACHCSGQVLGVACYFVKKSTPPPSSSREVNTSLVFHER
jgi:hypothetical protein